LFARTAIFLAGAGIASVLFINFCNLIYQCGCQSLWAGAAEHCNIHNPQSRHCPWCSIGPAGFYTVYGVVIGTQAIAAYGWPSLAAGYRMLVTLAAFPATASVLAVGLGLWTGYWS
jgi:hypothetical protein